MPRLSTLPLILTAALAFSPLPASAGIQLAGKPSVKFVAEGHPGALDIEGVSSALTLTEDGDDLLLRVPMLQVSTGIEMRDRHMNNEYVQTDRFPEVSLRLPTASLSWPEEKGDTTKGTAQATFTAHGVDRPVTVSWSLKRSKDGWLVKGSFAFDVSEHGIEIPSYLGVTVEPKMTAEAKFNIVKTGD